MNRWNSKLGLALIPVCLTAVQDQGCLRVVPDNVLADLLGATAMLSSAPAVETLVAEPEVSLYRSGDQTVGSVDSACRAAFELSIPQGQTLMVQLQGQAHWSDGARGRIGFALVVQERHQDGWRTIGLDGVGEVRTGPSEAKGYAVVPVTFGEPGAHTLRALVRSVGAPMEAESQGGPGTVDCGVVTIEVSVSATVDPAPEPATPPDPPVGEEWLAPAPPQLASADAVGR